MPTIASVPPTTSNPLAAPAPQPGGGEAGVFARQLERAQGSEAQAPKPQNGNTQASQDARAKARADAERPKAEKAPQRNNEAKAADDGASTDPVRPVDEDEDGETPVATDAAVLLASLLNRAVPAATRGAAATAGSGAGDTARAVGAADGQRRAAAGTAGAAAAADTGLADAARARSERSDTGPALNPATPPDGSAFQLQSQVAQAAGAQTIASAEAAAAAPAPYASQIQAPVGSPDFAPGLSAQVSLMVREGLQEARLQLNPVEMGPITVQIQIDGNAAQVTMTAEQAPTRDALEQAMPALAGALREEGLTLTGGGVFEQPRQAQGDAEAGHGRAGGSGSSHGGGTDGDNSPAPVRSAAPRGMVDVFA